MYLLFLLFPLMSSHMVIFETVGWNVLRELEGVRPQIQVVRATWRQDRRAVLFILRSYFRGMQAERRLRGPRANLRTRSSVLQPELKKLRASEGQFLPYLDLF